SLGDQRKRDLLTNSDQPCQTDILRKEGISVGEVIWQFDKRLDLVLRSSDSAHLLTTYKQGTGILLRLSCIKWEGLGLRDDVSIVRRDRLPDVVGADAAPKPIPWNPW